MSPLVSIIIPAYNVEEYITFCLDSLRSQTYPNIEAIIVDDGSKDNTASIVKEYAGKHEHFRYIHQENQGSGIARNTGIQNAEGEFLIFIDPDDWVESDYVERLMEAQNETHADLIICGATEHHYGKDTKGNEQISQRKSYEKFIDNQKEARDIYVTILNQGLVSGPWGKLFKHSVIKENKVEFPDFRRSQDIVFNYRYYNYVSSVKIIDYCGYNYRVFHSKIKAKVLPNYYKILETIYTDAKKMLHSWGNDGDIVPLANHIMTRMYGHLQGRVSNNLPLDDVMNDPIATEIASTAQINDFHIQICQKLLLKKNKTLLKQYLNVVPKLKNWKMSLSLLKSKVKQA